MGVELIGLAYDQGLTDIVWSKLTVRASYDFILQDDFRRKVDFRSMLYHKGQTELLAELGHFLRQGGERLTILELVAKRFSAGIEDFPNPNGELTFDFQLIRHFASLAMADDFLVADPFLRELLRRVGFLSNGAGWSLLETKDFDGISKALREVRMQDILEASHLIKREEGQVSVENLVRNYIEFLSYTKNNGLTPFFYNTASDVRRWGNLGDRKGLRSEQIVDLSLKPSTKKTKESILPQAQKKEKKDLHERLKLQRETDALLGGLNDSDPLIRQKSAESLGRLGQAEILPHLITMLKDPEPEVRQELVRAIGSIADPRANEPLLSVLDQDEALSVRLIAGYVLQKRNEKAALPILLDMTVQGKPHVAMILAYHSSLKSDEATLNKLKELTTHESPLIRRDIAFILGRLPLADWEDALVYLTDDFDEETRCNALYSLWDMGSKRVLDIAKNFCSYPSEFCARTGTILHHWALKA